jgi:hypothetical protein
MATYGKKLGVVQHLVAVLVTIAAQQVPFHWPLPQTIHLMLLGKMIVRYIFGVGMAVVG